MLGDQLRLKGAVTISGTLNQQLAKLTLQGLLAFAITGVAGQILYRLVLAVAELIGHLGFQRFLDQQFRELLEQPVLANQVFGLSVISQQAVH